MKTSRKTTITTLLFIACIKGFANYSLPVEPIPAHIVHDAPTKAVATSENKHSYFTHNSTASNISYLNFHGSAGVSSGGSFLDKLAIKAGSMNSYHNFLGCPNSKGVVTTAHLKYSALISLACVLDISWGVNSTKAQRTNYANNMNIVVVMSNPVSTGKSTSPFMNKLESNVPISMLSIVEVVVTFGHL